MQHYNNICSLHQQANLCPPFLKIQDGGVALLWEDRQLCGLKPEEGWLAIDLIALDWTLGLEGERKVSVRILARAAVAGLSFYKGIDRYFIWSLCSSLNFYNYSVNCIKRRLEGASLNKKECYSRQDLQRIIKVILLISQYSAAIQRVMRYKMHDFK